MPNYVNLDRVSANAVLESVVCVEPLEQGVFVALGELQEDGVTRLVTKSDDQTKQLVIHVSDGLVYDAQKTELDFVLEGGKVGRAYHVHDGMIISISKSAITGTVTKGAQVVPNVATAMKVDELNSVTTGIRGEVIALEQDMYAGELAVIQFRV